MSKPIDSAIANTDTDSKMTRSIRTDNVWAAIDTGALPISAMCEWAIVPEAGALVTFTGVVRDHAGTTANVSGIHYEAYVALVAPLLMDIVSQAQARWSDITRVAIAHRHGEVGLSEASVFVAVSSPHRPQAFMAARFCIDVIKTSIPIWKFEHSPSSSGWVQTGVRIEAVTEAAKLWDYENKPGTTQEAQSASA